MHYLQLKIQKNKFYGGASSYNARLDTSVLQKNEGTSYVVDLNEECGVSPGKYTNEFRNKKERIRKNRREKIQQPEFKMRGKQLKQSRSSEKLCTQERVITYLHLFFRI